MTGNRKGVTLVEVLVNIAIIGLLISLLLPAIQAARESARRIQCADHFRQVGIGMQNYLAAKQVFPTGLFHWDNGPDCCARPPANEEPDRDSDYVGWGWGTFLLPFIEEGSLYDRFTFEHGPRGTVHRGYAYGVNYQAAATFVDIYLCPSDPQGLELVECDTIGPCDGLSNGGIGANGELQDVARTNLAGVMGFGAVNRYDGRARGKSEEDPDHFSMFCHQSGAYVTKANGMLFNQSRISAADVIDGLSQTLFVGEVLGGYPGSHAGYFWVSADIVTADKPINGRLNRRYPTYPWHDSTGDHGGGFASSHPGGCHFLFVDGSVHFLAETTSIDVFHSMSTRMGGETLPDGY